MLVPGGGGGAILMGGISELDGGALMGGAESGSGGAGKSPGIKGNPNGGGNRPAPKEAIAAAPCCHELALESPDSLPGVGGTGAMGPGGTGNSGPPQGIAPNIGTKNRHKKKANNNELPNMES